eukprot:TRINITY_DN95103_c0_g1_i1.p1 TRINITY_DN95103_c0_g1~~TRINITY_DN95103_c0_g1_i1.p1  ORF type:complete len:146 (-),score=22.78 TRINITY_DN95103_c0_g1_i1:41-478(-)
MRWRSFRGLALLGGTVVAVILLQPTTDGSGEDLASLALALGCGILLSAVLVALVAAQPQGTVKQWLSLPGSMIVVLGLIVILMVLLQQASVEEPYRRANYSDRLPPAPMGDGKTAKQERVEALMKKWSQWAEWKTGVATANSTTQ